jgi:hypothetical protein
MLINLEHGAAVMLVTYIREVRISVGTPAILTQVSLSDELKAGRPAFVSR